MPSVHKGHYAEEQANGQPSSFYGHHFLPSLPSQFPNQVPSTSGHFRLVQSSSWAPDSTNNNAPRAFYSMPSAPNAEMTPSDETDHRMDRKKQLARRQLMDGLAPSHLIPSTELLRRTHSFIVRTDHGDANHERGRGNLDSPWRQRQSTSQLRHVIGHPNRSAIPLDNQNGSRARIAIQTWNELVEDLNRRKELLQLNHLDHLAILSDKASNDSESFLRRDPSRHNGHSLDQTAHAKSVLRLAEDVQRDGLGVTRYRPITPRFLAGLDRKKLPSRTLTQLWVNQLPDHRRSFRVTRPGMTLAMEEAATFEKHKL